MTQNSLFNGLAENFVNFADSLNSIPRTFITSATTFQHGALMEFGVCPLLFSRRLLSVFYWTEKRWLTTSSGNKAKKSVKIPESEAPKNVTCDWIGPVDKQSNLRPVHFYIPPDETQAEKNLRLKRKALQDFNQHFWSRQNIMFYKKKSEFIQAELDKRRLLSPGLKKQTLSPEEMAVFYKQFLQENYQNNLKYHREWYKRNVMLLWPAFKVALERFLKRLHTLHMRKLK